MSVSFDPNLLLSFYQAKLTTTATPAASTAASSIASKSNSATANDVTPWSVRQPDQTAMDAKVLSTTNFLDTSNVPLSVSSKADAKTEQDNQKLFSLYTAVNTLAYIAKMAQRDGTTDGQLAGLNTRFQAGMQQIQKYISGTTFNNFTLQAANPTSSVTSSAQVSLGTFDYSTKTLVSNANLNNALPGLSSSDSFTVSIKKGGTTTDVAIDLSKIQGPLTLDNVITYANQTLSDAGFKTRLQKTYTAGSVNDTSKATYGMQVSPGANETVSFSAAAMPSLYLAGNTGTATNTSTTTNDKTTGTAADQQGRLIKLTGVDASPSSSFSVNAKPSSGNTTAQATAVDASGNVYVIGNATGDFGNQLNQGTQDTYLTKYDSAGNVLWTRLLGSTGTANGYSLAIDPTGGVVIAGSTTGQLQTGSVTNGNTDSYVSKYDTNGNQSWVKQIQTLATNQAASVSVDSAGSVYIGGQVSGGVIGSGQTKSGGVDAYVAKLDNKGKLVYEQQFGTTASDSVAATAVGDDGSLYVASVQNGHAIVSKYANGDARSAAVWTQDLGDLQNGGTIAGLAVKNGEVYVAGTTQNGNLTAGGAASIASASSGGSDAFVFHLTDSGATATADTVSYVGTGAVDKAGGIALGSDGTVYLTGSTMGTFAGQSRNIDNVSNMFVTALGSDGTAKWTKQYGGLDGISSGTGIAVDNSGSSVLDALGLPKGTINPYQTVDLAANTTLRPGDSFKIQFTGTASRTATITIEKGETLQSLATKINIQLQTYGKASVNYTGGAAGLKIAVNPGTTLSLVAGPANFDALARLGIPAGTLTAPADSKSTSTATSTSSTTQAFGLGLSSTLDISTRVGADMARSQLLGVLSSIQSAYQKTNTPATATAATSSSSGSVSPYLQNQISSAQLALNMLA